MILWLDEVRPKIFLACGAVGGAVPCGVCAARRAVGGGTRCRVAPLGSPLSVSLSASSSVSYKMPNNAMVSSVALLCTEN
jgi:hypothetical protein